MSIITHSDQILALMRLTLLILISLFGARFHTQASIDTSQFYHFNVRNGFPSNNVYSVLQDKNGYLWFATDKGVVKYNGYSFKIFNTSNGLPSDDVWDLYEDGKGRIWISCIAYTMGYIKDEVYNSISLKKARTSITPYFQYSHGDFFVFSLVDPKYNTMNLVIVKDDVLGEYTIVDKDRNWLGIKDTLIHLLISPDFSFYIETRNGDVFVVDPAKGRTLELACRVKKDFRFFSNYRFVATRNKEIYSYTPGSREVDVIDLNKCVQKVANIKDFGAGKNANIYLFIPYQVLNSETNTIITQDHFYTLSKDLSLLTSERIDSLVPTRFQVSYRFTDKGKRIWYCTVNDGVWGKATNTVLDNDDNYNLKNCKYVGIVNDSLVYWWSRTDAVLYETVNGKIMDRIRVNPSVVVRNVAGEGNDLYISTTGSLLKYDRTSRKISDPFEDKIAYNISSESFPNGFAIEAEFLHIKKVIVEGDTLYTFRHDGVYRYKFSSDTVFRARLSMEKYNNMYDDTLHSRIWIYNYNQVLIYDKKTGEELLVDHESLNALGRKNIKKIIVDRYHNTYIMEGDRIVIYNSYLNQKKVIYRNFSLTDATFDITSDTLIVAGRFGVAYARITGPLGLSAFNIIPNRNHYGQLEDMVVTGKGRIILKTDNGLKSFNISGLSAAAQLKASDNYSIRLMVSKPYEKLIGQDDTLVFQQPGDKIRFEAVNLNGNGTPVYTYKILGRDSKWEETTSGELFIADLKPGKYYKGQCVVTDDMLRSSPYSFYIYRQPYWHQTYAWKTVFWIGAGLLFAGLVLAVILVTRYYVAKKNKKRRAQVELELRAIHSQINPHFIFNTLSTALYFINKKRFDDAYIHVNKFSRLLRSYLKASHDRYTILGDEIQMLRNYIELQQTRFEQKFIYQVEIDNKIPVNNIQIPSLLLQPLIENAINHGLFHRESGGELTIKFVQGADNAELICIIEDNGVGRAKAKEINEASSTRDSYGTKLTHQLLEIFREYEHMDIHIDYIDKQKPETGTIVTLVIKRIKYIA